MSIQQLQQQVDEWIKQYGVRYFNELTNMAILTEEVGEVARVMSRKYGEQSYKESDDTDLGSTYESKSCKANAFLVNHRNTETGGQAYPAHASAACDARSFNAHTASASRGRRLQWRVTAPRRLPNRCCRPHPLFASSFRP